jgi:RNA polymerase sigma factor (sigma-70 family)
MTEFSESMPLPFARREPRSSGGSEERADKQTHSTPVPSDPDGLYQLLRGSSFSFAVSLVYDEGVAEDLVQEAFLRFYSRQVLVESAEHALAWIITVVRNLARNRAKQMGYQAVLVEDESVFESTPDRQPDPETAAISKHRLDDLQRALESLEGIDKECMLLYGEEMTFQQMADELKLPLWTVVNKTRRATKLLKKKLNK